MQKGDNALFELYGNVQSYEREYFLTRQRPMMQSALNVAIRSKFNDFDLQAQTVDLILAKLIDLTSQNLSEGMFGSIGSANSQQVSWLLPPCNFPA